jgi:hypothetical protein
MAVCKNCGNNTIVKINKVIKWLTEKGGYDMVYLERCLNCRNVAFGYSRPISKEDGMRLEVANAVLP